MSFSIQPLNPASLPAAGALLAEAYTTDPSILSYFDGISPGRFMPLLAKYFTLLTELGLAHGKVLSATVDGDLSGIQIYYPPGKYPLPRRAQWRAQLTIARTLIPALGVRKLIQMSQVISQLEEAHTTEPHLYLEIACVLPRFQKQGLATAFTRCVFTEADAAGVAVYLETSNPTNLPLWAKLGFCISSKHDFGGTAYWSLLRSPLNHQRQPY